MEDVVAATLACITAVAACIWCVVAATAQLSVDAVATATALHSFAVKSL